VVKWAFAAVEHEHMLAEKEVAVAAKVESRSFEYVAWGVERVAQQRCHHSRSLRFPRRKVVLVVDIADSKLGAVVVARLDLDTKYSVAVVQG
jgi:hypothetical protein